MPDDDGADVDGCFDALHEATFDDIARVWIFEIRVTINSVAFFDKPLHA